MDENKTHNTSGASSNNGGKHGRAKKNSHSENNRTVRKKTNGDAGKSHKKRKVKKSPSTSEPVLENNNITPKDLAQTIPVAAEELRQGEALPQAGIPESAKGKPAAPTEPESSEPAASVGFEEEVLQPSAEDFSQPSGAEFTAEPQSFDSRAKEPASIRSEQDQKPEPSSDNWDDLVRGFSSGEDSSSGQTESKADLKTPEYEPPVAEHKTSRAIPEPTARPKEDISSEAPVVEDFTEKSAEPLPAEEKILPEERFSNIQEFDPDAHNMQEETFEDEVKQSFISAGFTPKKIIGCVMALLVVGGLVFFVFYGGKDFIANTWNKIFSSSGTEMPHQEITKTPEQKTVVSSPGIPKSVIDLAYRIGESYSPALTGVLTSSLQTAYIIGIQQPQKMSVNTGLDAAFSIGFKQPVLDDDVFKKYVRVYAELGNAYNTDFYGILNKSTDRALTLDTQLAMLEDVYKRAQDQFNLIKSEMEVLKTNFKNTQDPKNNTEKAFFEDLKNGLPNESYTKLIDYITQLQKQDEVKSRHNALSALSDYYRILLNKMNLRIEDIKKNKDALIQGVRVYEVPGSNVDVIIKGGSAGSTSSSLESTQGFSVIPQGASFVSPQIKNETSENAGFNVPSVNFKTGQ